MKKAMKIIVAPMMILLLCANLTGCLFLYMDFEDDATVALSTSIDESTVPNIFFNDTTVVNEPIDEATQQLHETTIAKSLFGLTEKEIEAIEEIISKSYVSTPYTLDDISEISRLGYDKMYVEGQWVENTQIIEYKVIYKNGETQIISINKIMLED